MNEKANTSRRFVVHDILLIRDEDAFISSVTPQSWVEDSLKDTLAVVVRRGPRPGFLIPVSVRGRDDTQRCAGFVSQASIKSCISPEELVARRVWSQHPRRDRVIAFRFLDELCERWAPFNLSWGPIGLIGFELATEFPLAERESDLAVLIRAAEPISLEQARTYWLAAQSTEIQVDIYLETPLGGVSLAEYLRKPTKLLIQTDVGPKFLCNPWDAGNPKLRNQQV